MNASPAFLGLPRFLQANQTPRMVIFGAGHVSTYPGKDSTGYTRAAPAIRAASQDDAPLIEHWDFDLGGPLFAGDPPCCIDAGDIASQMHDNAGNRARIEQKTREILALQAVPILIGGDCSATIPFLAGFADCGPIWVLQIDAHIDWRDDIAGESYGYSSPMRRASEMPHVAGLVQVGLRSVGSARPSDVKDALDYGSHFVTAREVHAHGAGRALDFVPPGARVVITLDCDSMDPGIMPGVAARTPGGLSYTQVIALIAGVSKRGRIAGFDLVELYPPADMDGLSALTAARILVNVIGSVVRQG